MLCVPWVTDAWVPPRWGRILQGLPGRDGKAAWRVTSTKKLAVLPSIARSGPGRSGWSSNCRLVRRDSYDLYMEQGRQFCLGVNAFFREQGVEAGTGVFLGFSSACLETLEYLRGRRVFTIVDQIDPLVTEARIVEQEREKWPGWETGGESPSAAYVSISRAAGVGHG